MVNIKNKMPVLFVGHGSPMNAIENNIYSRSWIEIAKNIPKPKAIISISAHWYTTGSKISDSKTHKTVYDIYGFPDELYKIVYNSPGSPELAHKTQKLISNKVDIDNNWGLDHGTWSVLHIMYPNADIPVLQLSVDISAPPDEHFRIGREIKSLRDEGVLIFASGNVVHNLSRVNWQMENRGYPWAEEFDNYIKNNIETRNFEDVINYNKSGAIADMSFTTPEHFYPLLYVLGASEKNDRLAIFNNSCTLGALSMTSYLFE